MAPDGLMDLPADAEAAVQAAVAAIVAEADVRETLEALIACFDSGMRDALIARVRQVIEERNAEYTRRRRAMEGRTIDGVILNCAGAVLMMGMGTYELIAAAFDGQPRLQGLATACGTRLLQAGVSPDMMMLKRLQEIYARAIRSQREASSGASAASPNA